MKKLLLLAALCALSPTVFAQEKTSESWLSKSGILTKEEITEKFGENLSPDQRAQMEKALQTRNAEIEAANAKFQAVLRDLLQADDAQIEKRVQEKTDAQKEAEKLARIKRLQPSRYNEIMRRKKKDAEKAGGKAP